MSTIRLWLTLCLAAKHDAFRVKHDARRLDHHVAALDSRSDSLHFNMQGLQPVSDEDAPIIQQILAILGGEWQWSDSTRLGGAQPGYGAATNILEENTHLAFAKHLLHGHGWTVLIGKSQIPATPTAATSSSAFHSLTVQEEAVAWGAGGPSTLGQLLLSLSPNGIANLHAFDHHAKRRTKWFRDMNELQVMHSPSSIQWIQTNGFTLGQGQAQAEALAVQLGGNLQGPCGPKAAGYLFPCKGKGTPDDAALLSIYYAWEEAQFIAHFFKFWNRKMNSGNSSESE